MKKYKSNTRDYSKSQMQKLRSDKEYKDKENKQKREKWKRLYRLKRAIKFVYKFAEAEKSKDDEDLQD